MRIGQPPDAGIKIRQKLLGSPGVVPDLLTAVMEMVTYHAIREQKH